MIVEPEVPQSEQVFDVWLAGKWTVLSPKGSHYSTGTTVLVQRKVQAVPHDVTDAASSFASRTLSCPDGTMASWDCCKKRNPVDLTLSFSRGKGKNTLKPAAEKAHQHELAIWAIKASYLRIQRCVWHMSLYVLFTGYRHWLPFSL